MIDIFEKHMSNKYRAFSLAILLCVLQWVAGYFVWDLDGKAFWAAVLFLSVVQFPIFPLSVILCSIPETGIPEHFAVWIFSTYLLKFYAISIAYSTLLWHWFVSRKVHVLKCVFYILFEFIILMITALDSKIGYARNLRWFPIEIVVTFWLYHVINAHPGPESCCCLNR